MSCGEGVGVDTGAMLRCLSRCCLAPLPTHLLLEDVQGQRGLAVVVGAAWDGLGCRKGEEGKGRDGKRRKGKVVGAQGMVLPMLLAPHSPSCLGCSSSCSV